MEILIANEAGIYDHELYQLSRIKLDNTEISLVPGNDYLIVTNFVADFFLRCVYRASRINSPGLISRVVVDARHQPSEIRQSLLVHFKLLYPELEIIGDETADYVDQTIANIRATGMVPSEVWRHWRTHVEYPTNEYNKIKPNSIIVAGCSISHGSGLDDPAVDRYDHLLAQLTGRPTANLSYPGSSLEYSANAIAQANLGPDNVVVWQLTGVLRWITERPEFYPESLPGMTFPIPIHDMDFFGTDDYRTRAKKLFVKKNVSALQRTVALLRKTGCRLVIIGADTFNIDLPFPEFVRVKTCDYGNDYTELDGRVVFSHPGPKTHRAYAEAVIKKLTDLYGFEQAHNLEGLGVV